MTFSYHSWQETITKGWFVSLDCCTWNSGKLLFQASAHPLYWYFSLIWFFFSSVSWFFDRLETIIHTHTQKNRSYNKKYTLQERPSFIVLYSREIILSSPRASVLSSQIKDKTLEACVLFMIPQNECFECYALNMVFCKYISHIYMHNFSYQWEWSYSHRTKLILIFLLIIISVWACSFLCVMWLETQPFTPLNLYSVSTLSWEINPQYKMFFHY